MTCGSGRFMAVLAAVWLLGGAVSAQKLTPNGFTPLREYDAVVDFTTETATFLVDGDDTITIQFVIGHPGMTPQPPAVVEVLVIRDLSRVPSSAPIDVSERHVKLLVNGESIERRGTLNRRHMDRPRTAAIAMVFRAEAFSLFADAASLEGHAFDCDFALTPDQVVDLRSVVQRWITAAR
jgi:hypothetical protein